MRKQEQSITKLNKTAQYKLDRQTTKISLLSSRIPGNDLLGKAATIKKIWIFAIGKRTKNTDWHCKETISRIRQSFYF